MLCNTSNKRLEADELSSRPDIAISWQKHNASNQTHFPHHIPVEDWSVLRFIQSVSPQTIKAFSSETFYFICHDAKFPPNSFASCKFINYKNQYRGKILRFSQNLSIGNTLLSKNQDCLHCDIHFMKNKHIFLPNSQIFFLTITKKYFSLPKSN